MSGEMARSFYFSCVFKGCKERKKIIENKVRSERQSWDEKSEISEVKGNHVFEISHATIYIPALIPYQSNSAPEAVCVSLFFFFFFCNLSAESNWNGKSIRACPSGDRAYSESTKSNGRWVFRMLGVSMIQIKWDMHREKGHRLPRKFFCSFYLNQLCDYESYKLSVHANEQKIDRIFISKSKSRLLRVSDNAANTFFIL